MTLLSDVMEAYLGPLLKKHNDGKYLTWEDLVASRAAATKVLGGSENIFVSKKVDNLHESQVKAYKEVGTKALKAWTKALALEPMEEGDSNDSFTRRCVLASSKAHAPSWPGLENSKQLIREEIQNRAVATFEKYHPEGSEGEVEPSDAEGDTEPEQSGEDVEEKEEEMTEDEDGEVEEKPEKNGPPQKVKNKVNNRNQNKQKNKMVRKKGTAVKGGPRKNFAGNRRGGKKNAPGSKNG